MGGADTAVVCRAIPVTRAYLAFTASLSQCVECIHALHYITGF